MNINSVALIQNFERDLTIMTNTQVQLVNQLLTIINQYDTIAIQFCNDYANGSLDLEETKNNFVEMLSFDSGFFKDKEN